MTWVALVRHGRTAWNEEGRLQGRADPPLSVRGRAEIAASEVAEELLTAAWVSSPLRRARETAALLHPGPIAVEPRLTEMDWGRWEGRTLADLRHELGPAMAENEARGLDFRPQGGESPRDVQRRIMPWLAHVAGQGSPVVAVTHKGVIRAALALAFEWDMTAPLDPRPDWRCAHLLKLDDEGHPAPYWLNRPLDAAARAVGP